MIDRRNFANALAFGLLGAPLLAAAQTARFTLVINLKAAKALGLTISQSLPLLRADEVIQ